MRAFAFLAGRFARRAEAPRAQAAQRPLRADYYPDEALAAMAKKLAAGTGGGLPFFAPFRFKPRLHDNARRILHAFHAADAAARRQETASPATQWLIDNYYTIDKAIKEIRLSFPHRLARRLPVYAQQPDMPRIFALAWFYIAHTDSGFSLEGLTKTVRAYQEIDKLTIAELWILPAALRFALAENARRIADAIEHNAAMRARANQAADEIILFSKHNKAEKSEAFFARYAAYAGDAGFSAPLLSRLENASADTATAVKWLHYKTAEAAAGGADALGAENSRQAADGVTMGNIIRAFKAIDDADWAIWFESVCAVDFALRGSSDFSALDSDSRNAYRLAAETIAKGSRLSEAQVAQTAIALARKAQEASGGAAKAEETQNTAADYLLGKKRPLLEQACAYRAPLGARLGRAAEKLKIAAIAVPVSALTLLAAFLVFAVCRYSCGLSGGAALLLALAALLPAADTAFALFNSLIACLLPPRQMVGYAFAAGVPESARTLVAVPILISSKQTIDEQLRNLEVHYLSNPQGAVHFALLSDWKDAPSAQTAEDLALLDYARRQTRALNQRCHSGKTGKALLEKAAKAAKDAQAAGKGAAFSAQAPLFFFLHRRRRFNLGENCFMGWERKRGKLHELNRLLRGARDTSFFPPDTALPANTRYVMTLDSDTKLTLGSVAKITGKMSHPLNRPRIDPKTQTVREGYGLIQPRLIPSLSAGENSSALQRIFSGERGLDPYVFAVSDTYQDILAEGTYTGKGLYDIDAFEAALKGRIRENSVLSHDLLEGGYARAAFAGDIELAEDYPISYYVDTARRHRWIRGDWQLLPYLSGGKNISAATAWKMLDNLRRSLMPAAWIAAFLSGWCLFSFKGAALWTLLLAAAMYAAPLWSFCRAAARFDRDYMLRGHIRAAALQLGGLFAHMALRLSFLCHSAYYSCDAIARSLFRLFVSHKHLLEWQSSDTAKSLPKTGRLSACFAMMLPALLIALCVAGIAFVFGGSGFYAGLPLIALWLFSPLTAFFISRPAKKRDALRLSGADKAALRRAARRDWVFYERFVTQENHFLPPDNFQELPAPALARRTSPTNIGLYLLSCFAAHDFGWTGLDETLERLEKTLSSLEKLEKFRGHIYNWYQTDTLKPLEPLYISTVDSGNLAGHLLTLAAALRARAKSHAAPEAGAARRRRRKTALGGISDNAALLAETLQKLPPQTAQIKRMQARLRALQTQTAAKDAAENLPALAARAETLAAAAAELHNGPNTAAAAFAARRLAAGAGAHAREDADSAEQSADAARRRAAKARQMEKLAASARRLAFAMQFGFLAHKGRRLLSIGYRIRENELDEGCYDLLASEARLAVLFAVAKGDIKHEYWRRLGRIMVAVGNKGALLSWSGSMFEYLMPPLIMNEPPGSVLHQTAALAVRRQMEYGRELRLPWGISEAAFNARDPQMNYQYSAFGVPSLGLQRGLSRNRVIAPYAAMLAAQFAPRAAAANLKRLEKLGALGSCGYYDSLDFTPSRVPEGQSYAVVRNYYAHHHGMAILAAANAAQDNIMRRRFHSDPAIEAVELLLQEKAPREIPVMNAKALNPLRSDTDRAEQKSVRVITRPLERPRATQLLSGGAYTVMLAARGSGVSRWNGFNITRWQNDAAEDCQGSFLFLRDCATGRWWSAADEPTRAAGEDTRAVFTAEKAEFYKHIDGIHTAVECLAAAGGETHGEGEGRRIKVYNQTGRDRVLEIISYGELALAPADDDAAHPVFSRMFIETEIADSGKTVFACRRRRKENEPPIHIAHFVSAAEGEILSARAETDRRAFIGRGRSIRRPAFFDKNAGDKPAASLAAEQREAAQGASGFVMDPVFCICARIKVPAHKKAELVFWTMAAAEKAKLTADIARCRRADAFDRAFTAVWTRSQIIRHQIGMTPQDVSDYQTYAGHLLFPERFWQAPKAIAKNSGRQSDLWPMAISGDLPICVLRIDDEADMPAVKEILRAHEYWWHCGLTADLAILNERHFSYAQDMQREIEWLSEGYRARAAGSGGRPHIFLLQKNNLSSRSCRTLLAAARIVLYAGNGSLAEQLAHLKSAAPETSADKAPPSAALGLIAYDSKRRSRRRRQDAAAGSAKPRAFGKRAETGENLRFWNGYGGFAQDGSYHIRRRGGLCTPHPWINIISNDRFGMHISAGGAAFSWAGNSRDYQLTPWSNDPVSNRPGEALYIVDALSKRRFSPVSAVERDDNALYETRHAPGSSSFFSEHDAIASELVYTVDKEQPLRFARLRLSNRSPRPRRLRLYHYAEWVLGNSRAKTAPFMIPGYESQYAAMTVSNPYHIDKPDAVSFICASMTPSSYTADRAEFIGAAGTVKHPQAIRGGGALSGKAEAGADICSAMAYDVSLKPNETREIIFCLGSAENLQAARKLMDYARLADFAAARAGQERQWAELSGGLQVKTPDDSFNLMVNCWLPYQICACRLKARAAFYQASGAYGLRDQLQDTLALLPLRPELARAQILAAASRQFREGDLQHWWLPESGAGVRTMISDDVVWLAYAAALYVGATGETEFLDEEAPFIEGAPLAQGQQDAYFQPAVSSEKASLYRHCALALNLALSRIGKNGLPLMLGGDWNDGMNHAGSGGKGESVWLGWFLGKTLGDFIPLAAARGDKENAARWESARQKLTKALESAGWDGSWYRRAYYDDGAPLGSHLSDECQIDTIAQSWSVISGLAPRARQKQAFSAMLERLYDDKAKLIRLFWPPFDKTARNPGYIKAYPPGVRENGGQYTHGALWSIFAAAELGDNALAYRLFSAANPIHHGAEPEIYRVEPYAVAADIYSVAPRRGMGGWTWYTGAAGWLYRAAAEAILGLRKRGGRLWLKPCLPEDWDEISLRLKHKQALYIISIRQNGKQTSLKLDGKQLNYAEGAPLAAEGRHEIELILARQKPAAGAAKEAAKPKKAGAGAGKKRKRPPAGGKTAAKK